MNLKDIPALLLVAATQEEKTPTCALSKSVGPYFKNSFQLLLQWLKNVLALKFKYSSEFDFKLEITSKSGAMPYPNPKKELSRKTRKSSQIY